MKHSQAKLAGCLLVSAAIATIAAPAGAVISLNSPTRNTAAPADPGQNTAWSLVGQIGQTTGVPIAPNLFIAANHTTNGGTFTFDGHTYATTAYTDVAGTDLRVFQIDTAGGTFSRFASLYDEGASGSEIGKPMFVTGRGTARGSAYVVGGEQRGYGWQVADYVQSWGTSSIDAIVNDVDSGDLLAFGFATSGLALTGGDSGGGLFVFAGGEWKLAGVNAAVDGRWSATEAGPYVDASVYDARGLWVGTAMEHTQLPSDEPITGSSYASRISSNRDALNAIFLASGNGALVPEPAAIAVVGGMLVTLCRRRRV